MTTHFTSAFPFGKNIMVDAIRALYQVPDGISDFIDRHIDEMKRNASATVRATGSVLEGAKFGFGVGYVAPLVLISVGQLILGNTLAAVMTVGTGLLLSNPIAMTCGATGAIFYGWKALSDDERNSIVARIAEVFEIGVEFIKAVVGYLLSTLRSLVSSEVVAEYRRFVTETASGFGRSFADISRSMKDRLAETASTVADVVGKTADRTKDGVDSMAKSVGAAVNTTTAKVVDTLQSAGNSLRISSRKDKE